MQDQEMLARLRESWPETMDYLTQVGQANNDLAVMRELAQRETYEASLTWLDQLAVGVEDLTRRPNAMSAMKELHTIGVKIESASQVQEYEELRQDHLEQFEEGREPSPEMLESQPFELRASTEQELWNLPELQNALKVWAAETAERHGTPVKATLAQAWILFNVCQFLESEPEQSPVWAAECLRSVLSSDFFEKAGNPTP